MCIRLEKKALSTLPFSLFIFLICNSAHVQLEEAILRWKYCSWFPPALPIHSKGGSGGLTQDRFKWEINTGSSVPTKELNRAGLAPRSKKGVEWKKLAASGIGALLHTRLLGSLPLNPSEEVWDNLAYLLPSGFDWMINIGKIEVGSIFSLSIY